MSTRREDLLDLIATTTNDLPKQEFEMTWTSTDYEWCRIYQNEALQIDGGTQIERKVVFESNGNARYRRPFDTDNPNVAEVVHTIKVPWTQIGVHYSWDEWEILQNKNSAKGFINLMTVRRQTGLWDLADLIEERAWKTPTSATDDLYPYGVPYYLNMFNAAGAINTTAGFVGATIVYQDATTGTACANIDAATETKWRNWAAAYTTIDNAFLKSFRLAVARTKFKVPLICDDPSGTRRAKKRIYSSFDVWADLMNLADMKDDNHSGKDVLGNLQVTDGTDVTINKMNVVPIEALDDADYDPLYCINFEKFKPVVHDGYWMKETEPMSGGVAQHTAYTVFLDGAHNNLCLNRRTAGFVMHKTTA